MRNITVMMHKGDTLEYHTRASKIEEPFISMRPDLETVFTLLSTTLDACSAFRKEYPDIDLSGLINDFIVSELRHIKKGLGNEN